MLLQMLMQSIDMVVVRVLYIMPDLGAQERRHNFLSVPLIKQTRASHKS